SVIRRQALRPESSSRQPCSAPTPKGETRPMPVTTTRLTTALPDVTVTAGRSGRSLVDILYGVANGQDGLGRVVGNLDAEFFFERHDEFDRIKAVGAQIVDEAGRFGDLIRIDTEVFDYDLLHALCGVAHMGILVKRTGSLR